MSKKVEKTTTEKDPKGMIRDELEAKINAELVQYEYGDLYITCSNCGTENLLEANIKSTDDDSKLIGINVGKVLGVNSRDHFGLGCGGCKASLVVHFKDAANPPSEEDVPVSPPVEPVESIEVVEEDFSNENIEVEEVKEEV